MKKDLRVIHKNYMYFLQEKHKFLFITWWKNVIWSHNLSEIEEVYKLLTE